MKRMSMHTGSLTGWSVLQIRKIAARKALISIQPPITIFLQAYLASSEKVMGKYGNSAVNSILLFTMGAIVTIFNMLLLVSLIRQQ